MTVTTCWPLKPSSASISPIPTPPLGAWTGQLHHWRGKQFPENSALSPQFQPCLPGIQHLREINMATSVSLCKQQPGQGWVGSGGRRVAASQDWAFVPAPFKSCFSTWTSYIRINPHQSTLLQADSRQHTRYRPAPSLPRGWGCLKEEEKAGLKEGVGESGLGQVLATPWLAPVR